MNIMLILFSMIYVTNGRNNLRVIGGRDATTDLNYVVRMERHFQIRVNNMVYFVQKHICSAAVLSPTWTLTAAHCIDSSMDILAEFVSYDIKIVIRYGSVLAAPLTPNTVSDVLLFAPHPAYRATQFRNDIGLLQTQKINIPHYAKISALDYSSLLGEKMIAAGYGLTNSSGGRIDPTLSLKKPLQILNVIAIACDFEGMRLVPALCIARRCGESATLCPGDSGGPTIHPSGIVAVSSLAIHKDCLDKEDRYRSHYVGYLTPVSPYIDWIHSHVNKPGVT